jgi:putative ABC transport system permease protein
MVGSRTSSINLLLFSVFKIGDPTNNIQWQSFADIAKNKQVDWAVPLSMGDSQ